MKLLRFFLLAIVAISLNSCGDVTKTITVENKYSVDLPSFLSPATGLNSDASLQYDNGVREFYVVVIDEPKKAFDDLMGGGDLGYGPDLDGYSELLVDTSSQKLGTKIKDKITPAKINGLNARLASFSGSVKNVDVYWKAGYIQGKDTYYQVLCWTLTENKDKYDAQFDGIIKSFKELAKAGK